MAKFKFRFYKQYPELFSSQIKFSLFNSISFSSDLDIIETFQKHENHMMHSKVPAFESICSYTQKNKNKYLRRITIDGESSFKRTSHMPIELNIWREDFSESLNGWMKTIWNANNQQFLHGQALPPYWNLSLFYTEHKEICSHLYCIEGAYKKVWIGTCLLMLILFSLIFQYA